MTRNPFPNTDRFQGFTLIGAGTLCLCISWLIYEDSQTASAAFNQLMTCGWLLFSACLLGLGMLRVQRGIHLAAQSAGENSRPGAANTINPSSQVNSGEGAQPVDDEWESFGDAKVSAPAAPDDPAWREARFGALAKDTYRVLDCAAFEGEHFDIEIDGQRHTLGVVVTDSYSQYRFHDEATPEEVNAEARALVAEHKGVDAAKAAKFCVVPARGT